MQTIQAPGVGLANRVAGEVRATLGRLGVNQAELARRLGVSEQWVSIRVRPQPQVAIDLTELEQIATALGVPVTTFLPTPERTS